MKIELKDLFSHAIAIGFGIVLTLLLCQPKTEYVRLPMTIPAQRMVYNFDSLVMQAKLTTKLLADLNHQYPTTIIIPQYGRIDSTTLFGNIPVREDSWYGSVDINAGKTKITIPLQYALTLRGAWYNFNVNTVPQTFDILLPKQGDPLLKFSGNVGLMLDYPCQTDSLFNSLWLESELFLTIKKRIGLEVRAGVNGQFKTKISGGGKAWF
jgi:hypothetical protein